jgi:hypothetical protein
MTEDEKKEEAIRLIESAESTAKKLEALGQEAVETARLAQDLARPLAHLFRGIPTEGLPPGGWDRQAENWRTWHAGVQGMQDFIPAISGMTLASVSSTFTTASIFFNQDPQMFSPDATEAFVTISQAVQRHDLSETAAASMRRLGLDRRGANLRSAVDLLIEAKGAMDRPVVGEGGPVSVLIPLRECINAVITELVRRRPEQEPAKNWKDKVVSIGNKCGRPSLPANHFDKIGGDAKLLMDELSGAKQTGMNRQRLMSYFDRGVLFLNALLDSVDDIKLKPP